MVAIWTVDSAPPHRPHSHYVTMFTVTVTITACRVLVSASRRLRRWAASRRLRPRHWAARRRPRQWAARRRPRQWAARRRPRLWAARAQSYQDGDVATSPPCPHSTSPRPHFIGRVGTDVGGAWCPSGGLWAVSADGPGGVVTKAMHYRSGAWINTT